MARLRLFASARVAAGCGSDDVPGSTVGEVLAAACERYGEGFGDLLTTCRVWLNGDQASPDDQVSELDEIAILPPVSGG